MSKSATYTPPRRADKAVGENSDESSILLPGRNCWRKSTASKGCFLVDAEAYFNQLVTVLSSARERIWIIGWNFDPHIKLRPGHDVDVELGPFLRSLVENNSRLEIRILVWAVGLIYSSKSLDLVVNHEWADHPRIHLVFDTSHPVRGSHHQKIVSIDDAIGFIGGVDLTSARWDNPQHTIGSSLRHDTSGEKYGPVHDVQCIVEGSVAADLADLAAQRWKRATGEKIDQLTSSNSHWPTELSPHFTDCRVGLARTEPRMWGRKGKGEAVKLTLDAIANARRQIYVETQYLASFRVGRALAKRLQEEHGPEIVIVMTKHSRGLLEQFVMATNRDRLIRRLKAADKYGRLRVMYAVLPDPDGGEAELLVHSKVLVIDDRFARVGSSNLNNRSEGLDTEADLAIEASSKANRRAIETFRNLLLSEHLACEPDKFASCMQKTGSMISAIEMFNNQPRGLREYDIQVHSGKTASLWGTSLLDPMKPYWPLQKLRSVARRLFGGSS